MFKVIPKRIEDAQTAEVMAGVLNFYWDKIYARILIYGETVDVALNNVVKELDNEQVEKPPLR